MKNRQILPVALVLTVAGAITTLTAQASDTGAFVGGLLAGKVLHSMSERTEAEKQQAYYAQQQAQAARYQGVPQAAPAPSAQQQTPQQRLDQLDKLAAGGYITPEEYKAKKKQIIDSM